MKELAVDGIPVAVTYPVVKPVPPALLLGSVGDTKDNALVETINAPHKAECIRTSVFHDGAYKDLTDVEYATASLVE